MVRYRSISWEPRHKLRLYRGMIGYATLWLSEACSGTRWARECAALVARGGCVIAGYRMGECRFVAAHYAVLQALRLHVGSVSEFLGELGALGVAR